MLDVQIGCTTRAMAHLTRGNFGYYLNVFPVLCQLVASAQKPKVARAMLFKMERLLLYNEKHPDITTFFTENFMTLRETVIENLHSILTHYVNRNVVTHDNYEKATCIAQQCRALRNELKKKVLKKKAQPAERLGRLQRLESKAFEETNKDMAEFLFKPFREMVAQLKADGRCSGQYADKLRPRLNWQAVGQKKLDEALTETEAFLANRDWMPPAPPVGLLAWLKHNKTTLTKVHAPECKRRGLSTAGGKTAVSERIVAHVVAHPLVFQGTDGKTYDARPLGYVGELPVSASLCCACKAASCVDVAAAAAAIAADAAAATGAAAVALLAAAELATGASAAGPGAATAGAAAAEADMSDLETAEELAGGVCTKRDIKKGKRDAVSKGANPLLLCILNCNK